MKQKFNLLLLSFIILTTSMTSVEAFSWEDLRIKYLYNYFSNDYFGGTMQYNLTVDDVLVNPDKISYIVGTDDPNPSSNTYYLQNTIDIENGVFLCEIYNNYSILQVDFDFNLTFNLKELGAHYVGLFFIPVRNTYFSFKNNYENDCNFTYETTFEFYNVTESGYSIRLEYIADILPTYAVKELMYNEQGELLRLYQSSDMIVNSTSSYFSYTEITLIAKSRTSAKTERVNAINLIVLQVGVLLTVTLNRRRKLNTKSK